MTGLPVLSPVNPSDDVQHRATTVTINGNPTPLVLDEISGTVTFSCNPGDVVVITDADSNATGTSLPSAPVTFTAPAPTNVPAQPTVVNCVFTP